MDVFYYWESMPNSRMPGYIKLCIDTWRSNIPDANITLINQNNLMEYSGGRVDVDRLKVFSLPLQSDVAAIAVLSERPGLFLDADTIIFPGFNFDQFSDERLTMYGDPKSCRHSSTGFFRAPHAENPLLLRWLFEAERRLIYQTLGARKIRWWLRRRLLGKPARVTWDYLGNSILDLLLSGREYDASIALRDSTRRGYAPTKLFVERYGDIVTYNDLWFHSSIHESEVAVAASDHVVCLQNSWTPAWYSRLEPMDVMTDSSLVSRVIRFALNLKCK